MTKMNEGRESPVKSVEISPGKCLYINSDLEAEQKDQLIQMIQEQSAFAWDYFDMNGST